MVPKPARLDIGPLCPKRQVEAMMTSGLMALSDS